MPIHSSRSPPPLTPLASAFRFTLPSTSIDWPAISNLDARQVIKDTDLDALENVLDSLVHGNLREDIREGTVDIPQEAPCRLFEASQLALQYLLYVQERLATELRSLKTELRSRRKELTTCHQTIFQLQRDLAASEFGAGMNSKTMMSRGLSHKGQDQNPFLPKLQVEDCQDHGACTTLAGDKQTSGGQPSPKHPSKASHQRHREEIESEGEEGNIERPAMTTPSPPPPAFENSEKPNREAQLRQSPRTHQALSQAYVRQLKRELPHELSGYPKKGVRSRFPHTIQQVMNMREEVKQEVAEELEKEFDEQGINSLSCGNPENAKSGLSSPQYKACMDALHRKRTAALRAMKPQERERAQFMLDSVKLHVEEVAQKEVGDSLLRFYSPLAQNRSTCRSKTEGSVPNTRQHGNV